MSLQEMLLDLTSLIGVDFTWKQPLDSPLQKETKDMTHRSEFCAITKSKKESFPKCVSDCSDSIHYASREEIRIRKICHAGGELICARIFSEDLYLGSLLIGPFTNSINTVKTGMPYFESAKIFKIFAIVEEVTPLIIEKVLVNLKLDQPPERHHKIAQVLTYIDKNYGKNITIEELALVCHLSGYRLMHLFKQEMKQTVFQYLIELRLKKACELLKATSLKINVIAGLAGFQSTNFFNSKFKQMIKMTPLAYREKYYIPVNP